MPEVEGDRATRKAFKPYPIGFFHIDIAEVQTAEGKLFLFVAIDRISKFAFVQLVESATRVTASAFLEALVAAVPYRIHTVLTDNGIQFRFPPRYANGPTARFVTHMFDMRCAEHGIEHRFTRINHPWTNGQVERMNRTIKEATSRGYISRPMTSRCGTDQDGAGCRIHSRAGAKDRIAVCPIRVNQETERLSGADRSSVRERWRSIDEGFQSLPGCGARPHPLPN